MVVLDALPLAPSGPLSILFLPGLFLGTDQAPFPTSFWLGVASRQQERRAGDGKRMRSEFLSSGFLLRGEARGALKAPSSLASNSCYLQVWATAPVP